MRGLFFLPPNVPKEREIKGILFYRGTGMVLLTWLASAESATNQEHTGQ